MRSTQYFSCNSNERINMKKSNIIPAALLSATLIFPTAAFAQDIPSIFPSAEELNDPHYHIRFDKKVSDFILKEETKSISYLGKSDGYDSVIDWYNDLEAKKADAVGIADEAIEVYSSIITDEEVDLLYSLEDRMTTAVTMKAYDKAYDQTNELLDELDARMPKHTYSSSSGYYGGPEGVLTKSGGVNSFGGRRETWYSSNVLYHYRTSEWTPDSNGVYRDSDGYVVVAASDLSQGSLVNTSHGMGKVYDSGCAAGTTDIYTNW